METGHALLHDLILKLRPWFTFVQRATHAQKIDIEHQPLGEFNVVVSGLARDGSPWTVAVPFTRERCFGPTYIQPPSSWFVVRRPCDHARDIVAKVLKERGAL